MLGGHNHYRERVSNLDLDLDAVRARIDKSVLKIGKGIFLWLRQRLGYRPSS
jgi:hypothetical protein